MANLLHFRFGRGDLDMLILIDRLNTVDPGKDPPLPIWHRPGDKAQLV